MGSRLSTSVLQLGSRRRASLWYWAAINSTFFRIPEDLEDVNPITLVVNEILGNKESVDDSE